MSGYRYPAKDIQFCLEQIAGVERLEAHFPNYSDDLLEPVLSEAAKFSEQLVAPTNCLGDQKPPKMVERCVQETPEFKPVYEALQEAGWPTLTGAEAYGGQALPRALEVAFNEGIQSANLSFSLCPLLTQGAIDAIETHASDELKATYLPNMVSGRWTGTMNLTEPSAGSDLAAIKTKAVREGDEHYRIFGQKIYITWGDHLMSDNIIHLVLARLPDAPEGVKGISLFLVPKYLLDEQGEPGRRNDVFPLSLERKLGIHGSPTCVMQFGEQGGALGFLVGEEHNGLAAMFTMMNNARQSVGLQGLAVAEAAYQKALSYAFERKQGSIKGQAEKVAIAQHADVQRMLWQMASSLSAMRALMYTASVENDLKTVSEDHAKRNDLYTPIVKGWMTELAQEVVSTAIQVHGGMGYIEETGVAQLFRDARILPIYEGTNGIQALDLVGRKLQSDHGDAMNALLRQIREELQDSLVSETYASDFESYLKLLERATQSILERDVSAQYVAYDYMMLSGYVLGGWLMLTGVSKGGDTVWQRKTRFYISQVLPRAHAHASAIHQFANEDGLTDWDAGILTP